jgi:predicted RecB family nuclease
MKITSSLFQAYIKCPTKCWLRFTGEPATGNDYAEWEQRQNESYRNAAIERLMCEVPEDECAVAPAQESLKTSKWRLGFDVLVATSQNLETRLHAVERVPPEGRGQSARLIPTRFVYANKLGKDEKLLLAFDAFVLSEILGCGMGLGKIIHGDNHATLKVKTSTLAGEARKRLDKIATLLSNPTPPDLVLNRHCAECEFQVRCRQKAIEKDDLSLLARMSEKERKILRSKGIFTVTQLSYTFRPRRRPKRLRGKREKYHHSLKALAIREKKIHIVGSPELKIEGTPVYLDVEGLPDRDFYYLIGMLIGNGESAVQHSLWADTIADEGKIWREFLGILESIERPVLIHYGSYETTFFKRMSERCGEPSKDSAIAKVINSAVNLMIVIYARIYFPTFSNGLKEIAYLAGARWTLPTSSGLRAIVWRFQWDKTQECSARDYLCTYNRDDCAALATLAVEVINVLEESTSRADIDFADAAKNPRTERASEIHRIFNSVLKSAHSDYSKARIKLTSEGVFQPDEISNKSKSRSRSPKLPAVKGRVIHVPRKRKCERHPDHPTMLVPTKNPAVRSLIDLAFTKTGCKKTVLKYIGKMGRCPQCGQTYVPPGFKQVQNQVYGEGFAIWVIYLRMVLRLSFQLISNATRDLFGVEFSKQAAEGFVHRWSQKYIHTEELLLDQILQSRAVHVDETRISILGDQQYVWVLTDGKRSIFRLTEGRETDFLRDILKDYKGALIADFYGGYDALQYRQQKCLVHLIRDLNDDLWKNPFNLEFEQFVAAVRDLLIPMVADAHNFGLRA